MAWNRRFKKLRETLRMPTIKSAPTAPPEAAGKDSSDESGIALFMVIAAMMILSVIVTEFTYVAQVNSRATVDSSDQMKAHYLAKTGFKLSLLRLRAYKEVKAMGGTSGMPEIPKSILDQIWSFPFFYPLPANVPGLTIVMKDEIEKFQNESTLPGKFTATIESESNRVSLNSLLPSMVPSPVPSPTGKAKRGAANPDDQPATAPTPGPSGAPAAFDIEEARKGVKDMIAQLIEDKFKADPDFADEYRDLNVEELFDNLLAWVDFSHTPKNSSGRQTVPFKRAPFFSLSELRLIHPIDDALYDLLAPNFTTFSTPGINVNLIQEPMLRALLPGITDEEAKKFFEDRDSTEVDGKFKSGDDFFKWIEANVGAYKSSTTLDEFKTRLAKQGVQILTDETIFKITVVAEVNKATRILEAWVMLDAPPDAKKKAGAQTGATPAPDTGAVPGSTPGATTPPANAAGLRLLHMRES
jgi:type II secretory pathway component PulK